MNEAVKRAVVALDYHLGDDSPDPISKTAFAAIVALVTPLMAELKASEARNAELLSLLRVARMPLLEIEHEMIDDIDEALAQSAPATDEQGADDCDLCGNTGVLGLGLCSCGRS